MLQMCEMVLCGVLAETSRGMVDSGCSVSFAVVRVADAMMIVNVQSA